MRFLCVRAKQHMRFAYYTILNVSLYKWHVFDQYWSLHSIPLYKSQLYSIACDRLNFNLHIFPFFLVQQNKTKRDKEICHNAYAHKLNVILMKNQPQNDIVQGQVMNNRNGVIIVWYFHLLNVSRTRARVYKHKPEHEFSINLYHCMLNEIICSNLKGSKQCFFMRKIHLS